MKLSARDISYGKHNKTITFNNFLTIPNFPYQRNIPVHMKKLTKKLKKTIPDLNVIDYKVNKTLLEVEIAVFKSDCIDSVTGVPYAIGDVVLLDGHTRRHMWKIGAMNSPHRVNVNRIYEVNSFEEMSNYYDHANNLTSAETQVDKLTGLLPYLGVDLKSQLFLTDIKTAVDALSVNKDMRSGIKNMKDGIRLIDEFIYQLEINDKILSKAKHGGLTLGLKSSFIALGMLEYRKHKMLSRKAQEMVSKICVNDFGGSVNGKKCPLGLINDIMTTKNIRYEYKSGMVLKCMFAYMDGKLMTSKPSEAACTQFHNHIFNMLVEFPKSPFALNTPAKAAQSNTGNCKYIKTLV